MATINEIKLQHEAWDLANARKTLKLVKKGSYRKLIRNMRKAQETVLNQYK